VYRRLGHAIEPQTPACSPIMKGSEQCGIREASVDVDLFSAPPPRRRYEPRSTGPCPSIIYHHVGGPRCCCRAASAHRYGLDYGRLRVGKLRRKCALVLCLCDSDNELTINAASASSVAPLVVFAVQASKPSIDAGTSASPRIESSSRSPRRFASASVMRSIWALSSWRGCTSGDDGADTRTRATRRGCERDAESARVVVTVG